MEITWLGYSCFRLKGSRSTVITDPYPPGLGFNTGKLAGRIVTVSHQHANHSCYRDIEGDPRVLYRPGEYEIADISIQGIASFHDNEQGRARGKNVIFRIQMDDFVVCHLGDLGHVLTTGQLEKIDVVDVLLVPVGGLNTINAQAAVDVVREIEPRVVIPMHYKTPPVTAELDTVDNFLKEIGRTDAVPQPKLNFSRSAFGEGMQVVLLQYPQ